MKSVRKIGKVWKSKPTIEGAGVHLKRAFGNDEVPLFDPFLLLDDFHSNYPPHYLKGFPWHPHRGIETITYVIHGRVEHGDSMGNKGVIASGDVQWMTAGSGIIHQEMPRGDHDGLMWGFQFWANLPASHKMMDPRYRGIVSGEIPEVTLKGDVRVKVICGEVGGVKGPVRDVIVDPAYLDVTVPPETTFSHPIRRGHKVFAYVVDGEALFRPGAERLRARGGGGKLFRHEAALRLQCRESHPVRGRRRGGHYHRGEAGPLSPGIGKADRRAGRLVRPHRHEHPGGIAGCLRGIPEGHLYQI